MMALRPLTERDLETLNELWGCTEALLRRMDRDYALTVGFAPIEFGGGSNSHHGKTATKLVKHGFVEHKMRGKDWGDVTTRDARGSKVYRASVAGRQAIDAWRTLQKGEIMGTVGYKHGMRGAIPKTGYRPLTDEERTKLRLICHLEMPNAA